MSNSKTRLGRGLGGLISGVGSSQPQTKSETSSQVTKKTASKQASAASQSKPAVKTTQAATTSAATAPGYREIEVNDVVANPYQPRREIHEEYVEELAKSIQSEGLLQPIVVRAKGGKFELIAGERRLRAFKYLKIKTIPARIIEASDASSATLALIENLQRENLNPIDEALGYASLVRDFDLTQEAAAERVGKGRATVANALRLLTLGSEIQGYLSRRLISTGHAKVLLGLESLEHRKLLARRIIETGMSVREAEAQVRRLKEGRASTANKGTSKTPEAEQTAIRDLEKRMGAHFNTRVALKHTAKKGRITIEYFGNEDLDRILEKLGLQ
ncbi:ParB/RepB/Spo0J family partition protein [Coraliomargarita sp. SDUM461004]|uniref:ParB/RepB/Spo0J family partition protein n=1 Tax=Thalassobacterium sedimentorum TaxID=3041258 RepID=A0ABU1AGC2_9BACT|nr:ParB/RepB/Spo0J family partition protein [Coraliomargarita sp. SDUM461004]MDQ8193884.1 ParB/RepB/Spo0J family partition protein [Coraliomargarita sp. SDUM461004]